jgi:hypothetical protein
VATAGELQIILTAQDQASAQLRALGGEVQRLERQVEGVRRGGGGGGLLGALGIGAGFAAAQQTFQALGGVLGFVGRAVVGLNAGLEQTTVLFEGLTGSAGRAQQIVQALRQEAARSPFGDAETIAAGRTLITVSDGTTESLLHLVQVSERLAAIDPAQGLEGASVALREAMSGDFQSVAERFELSRASLQRWREQGLSNLQAVEAELNRLGVTAEVVERLGRTFEGRRATITSFFDEISQRLGAGVFQQLSDAFGHMVALIAQYGDRLRQVATDLGATFGALLERLAGTVVPQLVRLLDALSPGLGGALSEELTRAVAPAENLARATGAAAAAGADLTRQLADVGVAAAGLQLEADRVRRSYDDQLEPLQRQLRLLQQSADLQRVQSALASNRAAVEQLRLGLETQALRRAAGGNTDPAAAGLTTRQRAIALALQERELRQEELRLTEQQRPAVQTLQQQIEAIQEAQRGALEPLERQLATYREQAAVLQLQRQQAELLRQDAEAAAQAVGRIGTGAAPPEAVQDSRQRGEALADGLLKAYQDWVDANGGSVWQALGKSLSDWLVTTGLPLAKRIGGELGKGIGESIGPAILEALKATFLPGGTPQVGGAFDPQAGLPRVRAGFDPSGRQGQPAPAGPNVTVNVDVAATAGLTAAQVQAMADDAARRLAESLAAAAAGTDPGPNSLVQGAGR